MDGSPSATTTLLHERPRVTDAAAEFADRIVGQLDRSYRLATVILGSAMEAEDAVADAALAAWRNRGRLREHERFDAWFARILMNGCRDRLRVRGRRPIAEMPSVEVGAAGADLGVDFREGVHQRDALSRAFESLEPDERIVLVLRFWQDLPIDAIADRLGIPSGTVKSRLHHATARLRAALMAGEHQR
ncbi:MAG TPA: sigma-70 family RNA polymerase sigma factor [Candidatus Limnocylindrales bacterium]|nr:sigma-70 family RNA polymerase sigma factor [Candidatus Limnocylindrales bacterium]